MIHLCPDEFTALAPLASWLQVRGWRWPRLPRIWWRRRLGLCRCEEMVKERREDGHLDLVCTGCGYRVKALQ